MTQPTNIGQLKQAAREKYWDNRPKKKMTGRGIVSNFTEKDLDEIVTSTYLQAVEDCEDILEHWIPRDPMGYGVNLAGKGMTLDDHKRNFAKDIKSKLQSLKQTDV